MTARRRHVVGAGLAVLLAATVLAAPGVAEDRLPYDPESCATDPKEMVYLAFGRTVLRVPMHELTRIIPMSDAEAREAPAPPDPAEPMGCPGRPIQGRSYIFAYTYEALRDNPSAPHLRMGVPTRLAIGFADLDAWSQRTFEEEQFLRRCERHGARDARPSGLIGCLTSPGAHFLERRFWAASYQAPPDVYTAPFGRPFVVDCYPGSPRTGSQQCSVSYRLHDRIGVSYRFDVRQIPIDDLISFDRALRQWIANARVDDFIWLDERIREEGPAVPGAKPNGPAERQKSVRASRQGAAKAHAALRSSVRLAPETRGETRLRAVVGWLPIPWDKRLCVDGTAGAKTAARRVARTAMRG